MSDDYLKKYAKCKICKLDVDLTSGEQSVFANVLKIHQEPCLHVYIIAQCVKKYGHDEHNGISELEEHAERVFMLDYDYIAPYLSWMIFLYYNLFKHKEIMSELESRETAGRNDGRLS